LLCGSLLLPAEPATAGGLAHSECDGEGCEATAKHTREPARPGRKRKVGRTPSPVACRYRDLDVPADAPVFRPDGSKIEVDGTGRWIERTCVDARDLAEIKDDYGNPSDPVSAQLLLRDSLRAIEQRPIYVRPKAALELVEDARSRLTFPLLRPRSAPDSPWTFVYLPTALWLDGEALQPRFVTAEVPGVRVTLTAKPEAVHWDTGDSQVVVCPAPLRPPDPDIPGDRGNCAHTWSWPSNGPDGSIDSAYEVTATVMWHVTWTAEGAPGGGDLGIIPQRSGVLRVPVAEIHIVNAPPTP
jgi:hypothetical protein